MGIFSIPYHRFCGKGTESLKSCVDRIMQSYYDKHRKDKGYRTKTNYVKIRFFS